MKPISTQVTSSVPTQVPDQATTILTQVTSSIRPCLKVTPRSPDSHPHTHTLDQSHFLRPLTESSAGNTLPITNSLRNYSRSIAFVTRWLQRMDTNQFDYYFLIVDLLLIYDPTPNPRSFSLALLLVCCFLSHLRETTRSMLPLLAVALLPAG